MITIHCRVNAKNDGEGIALGDCEIWADKPTSDLDKAIAQFIGHSIKNACDGLTMMSTGGMFTPPTDISQENEKTE